MERIRFCDCPATGAGRDRLPVLDAEEKWALRCPKCRRLDPARPFGGGVLTLALPKGGRRARGPRFPS